MIQTTNDIISLRASSLPMAFRCAGSLMREADHIDGKVHAVPASGEEASLGTAVHEVLRDVVRADVDELPDLMEYANRWAVDADDLAMLARFGLKAWRELRQYFPSPMTEVELSCGDRTSWELTGHLDVYAPGDQSAGIIDWKSGRLDVDSYHQMAAYARLSASDCKAESFICPVVYLREGNYRVFRFTREDLSVWQERLVNEVVQWDSTYRPGEQCRFCARQLSCPARSALVQQSARDLAEFQQAGGPLTHADILSLYRRAKVVSSAVEHFDKWLRQQIEAAGPIVTEEASLELSEQDRDQIKPLEAWPMLSQKLDEQELAACVKIGKTALLDAIGAKAPPRGKGKAKAELMEELRAAGAVDVKTVKVLREVRR